MTPTTTATKPTGSTTTYDPVDPAVVRQAQERAIGGGVPDWRDDLEEATALELLRRRLGAEPISHDQAEA